MPNSVILDKELRQKKSTGSHTPSSIITKKRRNTFEDSVRSRNFDIPKELIQAAKAHKLAFLIGAGLSKQADPKYYPNWKEFLTELASEAKRQSIIKPDQSKEILSLISSGEYLIAGQYLKDCIPKERLETFFSSRFRSPNINFGKLSVHNLLFDLNPEVILTTNYDTLLEDVFANRTGERDRTYTYNESVEAHTYLSKKSTSDPPLIFKLHGSTEKPSGAIFSEYDYRKLIYRSAGYRTLLSAIFVNYTVLILGFSLNDREINLTLESLQDAFEYSKKADFIFLSAKGRTYYDTKNLVASFGVQPIWYKPVNQHREVLYFLNRFLKEIALTS